MKESDTLCDPMDCTLPGASIHVFLQAWILEWVAISFSRGSSWPRDWTQVSCIAGRQTLYPLSHQGSPLLWPLDGKNWLLRKDPDAGKDWRQEEKGTTEDEMVGCYHWLDGHEFEQAPGVGDGHGSLACCSSPGLKELDMAEGLNWTEPIIVYRTNNTILFYTNFSLKQLYRYYFCN